MKKRVWAVDPKNPLVVRPCEVVDGKVFQEEQVVHRIQEDKEVATVSSKQDNPEFIAKMIAAAPDMYDVLQTLDSHFDFSGDNVSHELKEAFRKAKNALMRIEY
jgi:hypothetical protein